MYDPKRHDPRYGNKVPAKKGNTLNIGWTIGEEILFKPENEHGKVTRTDLCRAISDACVLGIEKRNLLNIKKTL